MFETTYVPVIIGAYLSPNPANVGDTVLISIAATAVECVPSVQTVTAGEFTAGEV